MDDVDWTSWTDGGINANGCTAGCINDDVAGTTDQDFSNKTNDRDDDSFIAGCDGSIANTVSIWTEGGDSMKKQLYK